MCKELLFLSILNTHILDVGVEELHAHYLGSRLVPPLAADRLPLAFHQDLDTPLQHAGVHRAIVGGQFDVC